MHDLLIQGVLILDGTGATPYQGSVAVRGDRISHVGTDRPPARQIVDGRGLCLMPGIIDAHTHYDAQLTWDPLADPSFEVGVTTVVIGNCGFTIAPCRPGDRDLTIRNLTQVEGMSLEALQQGIQWDFESVAEYFASLERRGVGPNVAGFVGHSAVRTYVMGHDATRRVATDEEIAAMAQIVREAMASGAVGFSTSTNESHNGDAGVPMPSRLADEREMLALAKAMGEQRKGIFMITKGQVTNIAFLDAIAQASGRPVLIAPFLHNQNNSGAVFDEIRQLEEINGTGRRMYATVSCLPLTFDFTLNSAYVFEGLDAWKPAMKESGPSLRRLYADPMFRTAVQHEMDRTRGKRLFNSEWDKVRVFECFEERNAALEGKSVEDLSRAAAKRPLDYLLDLALDEDLRTIFTAQLRNTDEVPVKKLLQSDVGLISLSDAGAHLSFLCDAGYGLHLLGHWVRDKSAMPLEHAVYKLTGQPAEAFGISGRGALRVGAYADLLLFDATAVARGKNQRVRDLPAGAQRQRATGAGVRSVWVNGRQVVQDGKTVADAPLAGRRLSEFESGQG